MLSIERFRQRISRSSQPSEAALQTFVAPQPDPRELTIKIDGQTLIDGYASDPGPIRDKLDSLKSQRIMAVAEVTRIDGEIARSKADLTSALSHEPRSPFAPPEEPAKR